MACFFGQSSMRFSMCLPTSSELRARFSFSITSSVASAAAMHTGFPPKVEACEPGTQSMISARVMVTQSGMPDAIPLATQTISGCTPVCSIAHHFPVRAIPDCTSSATSRIPCLSQIRRSSCMKFAGAGTYPPSP